MVTVLTELRIQGGSSLGRFRRSATEEDIPNAIREAEDHCHVEKVDWAPEGWVGAGGGRDGEGSSPGAGSMGSREHRGEK